MVQFMEHRLTSSPNGCLGLHGGARTGKTWLARALCASLQRDYPGQTCLVKVSAEGASRAALVVDAVQQLGLEANTDAAREQVNPEQRQLCSFDARLAY